MKTQLPQFGFQKIDFHGLGTVFHVVSFTVHTPTVKVFFLMLYPALPVLSYFG